VDRDRSTTPQVFETKEYATNEVTAIFYEVSLPRHTDAVFAYYGFPKLSPQEVRHRAGAWRGRFGIRALGEVCNSG
jgi:hypothetical protein